MVLLIKDNVQAPLLLFTRQNLLLESSNVITGSIKMVSHPFRRVYPVKFNPIVKFVA
jgi:hypothetical protein